MLFNEFGNKEEIMEGLGHGHFLMRTPDKCCEKIKETLC